MGLLVGAAGQVPAAFAQLTSDPEIEGRKNRTKSNKNKRKEDVPCGRLRIAAGPVSRAGLQVPSGGATGAIGPGGKARLQGLWKIAVAQGRSRRGPISGAPLKRTMRPPGDRAAPEPPPSGSSRKEPDGGDVPVRLTTWQVHVPFPRGLSTDMYKPP